MIAGLKPYPVMKDSGLLWLGEVPKHWDLSSLRRRLIPCDGIKIGPFGSQLKLDQMSESGYKVYGQANVIARDFGRGRKFVDQSKFDELSACEIRPGDLVVTMMGTSGRCARVPDSAVAGIMDSHLIRLRLTNRVDSSFAARIIDEASYVKEQIAIAGKGSIMHGLNSSMIKDLLLALPPVHEQAAIVSFLEHADRRIRHYIRAKQKLIKLLEEQKQAISHRAVTRGLDPNVRLKPSGVERLGDVPEHWEVRRLKSLVQRIDQGVSPQAENYLADNDAWGVLKAGCVNRGVFREKEHKRLPWDLKFDPQLAVAEGDVLISRASGSPHLVGSVGRVPSLRYKLILSDKTFRPVFQRRVDPDFMVLAMNSRYYRYQVEQAISGAEGLANNLPLSSLRAFSFAVPPFQEQREIVENLRAPMEAALRAVARVEREISLFGEYRTRMIADVVTGKFDVREAAARLPEEIEEPEPLDESDVGNDAEEATDDLVDAPEEAEA